MTDNVVTMRAGGFDPFRYRNETKKNKDVQIGDTLCHFDGGGWLSSPQPLPHAADVQLREMCARPGSTYQRVPLNSEVVRAEAREKLQYNISQAKQGEMRAQEQWVEAKNYVRACEQELADREATWAAIDAKIAKHEAEEAAAKDNALKGSGKTKAS